MAGPGKHAIKNIESRGRCGHPYCGDCQTRRGNRRGNRRIRQTARQALRSLRGRAA